VDAGPGDRMHESTLLALDGIGGKGFGHFADPEEDWTSSPGDVLLTFLWRRRQQRLLIPAPGRYLSPALATGLNASLPADGRRLWFLEHDAPIGIVTSATSAERAELQRLTGLRLDHEAPSWWTALAPASR
jgi:hypothetical protein